MSSPVRRLTEPGRNVSRGVMYPGNLKNPGVVNFDATVVADGAFVTRPLRATNCKAKLLIMRACTMTRDVCMTVLMC